MSVPDRSTWLITTPSLVVHGRYRGATAATSGDKRFARVAPRLWELVFRCLQPVTVAELTRNGWSEGELAVALDAGLVSDADAPATATASLWERHNWLRMGHLLRTQIDIPYLEGDATTEAEVLAPLSQERRERMEAYLEEGPYPPRVSFEGRPVSLPGRNAKPPRRTIDASYSRRSIRRFAPGPLPAEAFGNVLWTATANIRVAESSKASGDPYYLLNSFYTWADIHVVVQDVEGIERGVYRYDPVQHRLHVGRVGVTDEEILATIARQPWALGSGAALYLCSQWDRYRFLYRHSRAYLNLLIQVGELAQEFVTTIERWGLGAWESPAIQEREAAAMLNTPDGVDPILFLKFGTREQPPR